MEKGDFFAGLDRYIYYGFEDVMFRWDSKPRKVWMKFIGDDHDIEVPHGQRLFNEAIINGSEISKVDYEAGFEQIS